MITLTNLLHVYFLTYSSLSSADPDYVFIFLSDKDAPAKGCFVSEATSSKLTARPLVKVTTKIPEVKDVPELRDNKVIILESAPNNCSQSLNTTSSLYTMDKQSYEIILIVDNRENYGIGKLKDLLCPKLASNGVKFEIRPLTVGDFLWIAKDRLGREAVLDIIVERKRFDDLCSSIMDNRFKDQKLRMKRLGISRILYLVEKCASMKNLKMDVNTLYQSLVNAEINDCCDVKVTENGGDTIEYLTMLTRKLHQKYKDQDLSVYQSYESVIDSQMSWSRGLDYGSFSQSSQKTKPLKVSEMFAKHLMCISGVTPEKAKMVIDKYPVPRLLMAAYDQCEGHRQCWALLSDMKLSGNRKFGLASSKAIYCAYTRK